MVDIFAKNEAGRRFKQNIKFEINSKSEIEKLMKIDDAGNDFPILKVAAGKIPKKQKDKNKIPINLLTFIMCARIHHSTGKLIPVI
jgi:hypothetical protein